MPSPLSGQLPGRLPSCLRAWEVWASCAIRVAPAAYWAAWADALPVMRQRRPEAAARCARELSVGDEAAAPSLRAAALAGEALDGAGWSGRPGWARPTPRLMIRQSRVIGHMAGRGRRLVP